MVLYGQFVVGPPGAGKSTYCLGMMTFMTELGKSCHIVNLDFANDSLPYTASIDVRDLIKLESVMEEYNLGPNGGLVYCMETLLASFDWLADRLTELDAYYVIFDCPGQVELYTHYSCVQDLLEKLQKKLDSRLCSVGLIDAFYCSQPTVFISAVLLATSTMLRLGLPHVNVLSKVDLLSLYGPLPFNLTFFTELESLAPLTRYIHAPVGIVTAKVTVADGIEHDDDDEDNNHNNDNTATSSTSRRPPPLSKLQTKLQRMSENLCEILDEFGLVSFLPLNIQDGETVGRVLAATDKANGFSMASFTANEIEKRRAANLAEGREEDDFSGSLDNIFKVASSRMESLHGMSLDIQEKYYATPLADGTNDSDNNK